MSHFDSSGNAHMVDVSAKPVTVRHALASGEVRMQQATAQSIQSGDSRKGDVLAVARLAAIQASKLTQQLIPLCHAIPIEAVTVDFDWPSQHELNPNELNPNELSRKEPGQNERESTAVLRCHARVQTTAKTGVEMEAMTAVSVACLTVYDMAKSIDRSMTLGPIQLLEKSGGKSGDFRRDDPQIS